MRIIVFFFFLNLPFFVTAHGSFLQSNLTVWTNPWRKRVEMGAMQIQLDLRLFQVNVWSQEKQMDK